MIYEKLFLTFIMAGTFLLAIDRAVDIFPPLLKRLYRSLLPSKKAVPTNHWHNIQSDQEPKFRNHGPNYIVSEEDRQVYTRSDRIYLEINPLKESMGSLIKDSMELARKIKAVEDTVDFNHKVSRGRVDQVVADLLSLKKPKRKR